MNIWLTGKNKGELDLGQDSIMSPTYFNANVSDSWQSVLTQSCLETFKISSYSTVQECFLGFFEEKTRVVIFRYTFHDAS
jgi:hypothetical protein